MPTLVKPRAKPKDKPARRSNVWHICFWDRSKKRTRLISTTCRDKRNAEKRLRSFIDMLEDGTYYRDFAPKNPFLVEIEQAQKRVVGLDIEPLLDEYEADLRTGKVRKRGRGKPPTEAHVTLTMTRLRTITTGLRTAPELTPEIVERAIKEHTKTQQTAKHYGRVAKAFASWLASTGRLPSDPLNQYSVQEVQTVVHDRGPFSWEQVIALSQAATIGATHGGLTGPQRSLLWLFAAGTGFRMKECAAVRKRDLGPDCEWVCLSSEHTKNDKEAKQPLPPFVRDSLRDYAATLADEAPLWPGSWLKRPSAALAKDAKTAGVAVGRKNAKANGGRVLDCHSFRHTFATLVDRAGVSERLARKLARASSGALLDRYTTREFSELVEAVAGFPTAANGNKSGNV